MPSEIDAYLIRLAPNESTTLTIPNPMVFTGTVSVTGAVTQTGAVTYSGAVVFDDNVTFNADIDLGAAANVILEEAVTYQKGFEVTGGDDSNDFGIAITGTTVTGLSITGVASTAALAISGATGGKITSTVTAETASDPGRQVYLQRTHTGTLGSGKGLTGIEVRSTFNGAAAAASSEVKGGEFKARHTGSNTYNVGTFKGVVGNCDSKSGAKTITSAWAVEGQIDCGTGSTITTAAGVRVAYNEDGTVTNAYGVFVDGTSVWNVGVKITDSKTVTGIDVGACTTGINLTGAMTDGLIIGGACSDNGIEISGACTGSAIEIVTGTFGIGLNVNADGTTGIAVANTFSGVTMVSLAGAASGDGILISGACADAIHISGTNTATGVHISGDQVIGILFDVDAAATDGLKIAVDDGITLTTGINIDRSGTTGVCTTAISIDTDGVTGIEIAAGFTGTTMLSLAGTASDGINISGICADGIHISAAATTTGLNVSADCVTGITIGAQTTAGITIGATATGIGLAACTTAGLAFGSTCTMLANGTLTGAAAGTTRPGMDFNWTSATTYGAGGDPILGSNAVEGFLQIGDPTTACQYTGLGSKVGIYINADVAVADLATHTLVGGIVSRVTVEKNQATANATICGITSYIRNVGDEDTRVFQAQEFAIRGVIYTADDDETLRQTAIHAAIIDLSTVHANAHNQIGLEITLNLHTGTHGGGGESHAIYLDSEETTFVRNTSCIHVNDDNYTYFADFDADGDCGGYPAHKTTAVAGDQHGFIKVAVDGTARYIPLYTTTA